MPEHRGTDRSRVDEQAWSYARRSRHVDSVVNAGSHRVTLGKGREVITVEDVARILVWANGGSMAEIAAASSEILVMDDAQQCLEDLAGAS